MICVFLSHQNDGNFNFIKFTLDNIIDLSKY